MAGWCCFLFCALMHSSLSNLMGFFVLLSRKVNDTTSRGRKFVHATNMDWTFVNISPRLSVSRWWSRFLLFRGLKIPAEWHFRKQTALMLRFVSIDLFVSLAMRACLDGEETNEKQKGAKCLIIVISFWGDFWFLRAIRISIYSPACGGLQPVSVGHTTLTQSI